MKQYNPADIETRIQQEWDQTEAFKVIEDPDKEKFYCLSMFPYPSGRLHMGHARNYTIGDVISRYQMMKGKNVMQPMGWDAFGMPAENAAMKSGVPPANWTYENIDYMRSELKRLGFAYDWSREVTTCRPEYYRWEQWLFTRLFEKGLVYKKVAPVNWCPHDKTVLANEQVHDGCCWRCDTPVVRKEISQWFMKITQYADELLDDIDKLDGWPDPVRTMQRNWIGRSHGLDLDFHVAEKNQTLTVYTTRPDTLMGVSYLAIAAEHPLALAVAENNAEVAAFIAEAKKQDTTEATLETMEKKGVATGLQAVHPVSGESVPVWIANFVLMGYGTGAVMAVPAHDQRDYEFASKYGLDIKQVIYPADGSSQTVDECAYVEKGLLKNSGEFDGLDFDQSFDAIADWLEAKNKGKRKTNFRLRDWGVSRQRYWGTPIPIIHCDSCGQVVVPEKDLPVVLPEDVEFDESGSPLKKMPEFYQVDCPQCGKAAQRETDTFDTFFESSWYYARYTCPDQDNSMLDERANYWLPVDQYIGGIEHAVMHLLYARFFHKLMRDLDVVSGDEPIDNLLTQGMVVAETYARIGADGTRQYFAPDEVTTRQDDKGRIVSAVAKADNQPVEVGNYEKMSKSKNNGVDPQELIARYGADTVRLFSMFAAPPTQSMEWSDDGVEGSNRFLRRVWRLVHDQLEPLKQWSSDNKLQQFDFSQITTELKKVRTEIHQLLQQINRDVEKYQFNTVVAAGMKLLNALSQINSKESEESANAVSAEGINILLRILYPIVPHITTELWQDLAYQEELQTAGWPEPDASALVLDQVTMVVQVNGKKRDEMEVPKDWNKEQIEEAVMTRPNVSKHLQGMVIRKVIVVPAKLINIVAAKQE